MRCVIAVVIVGCAIAVYHNISTPSIHRRIVGGFTVNIANFPYQLSLSFGGRHTCGASIISANWAVTAAHCVFGRSISNLSIRSGSSFHGSGGTNHAVVSAISHPNYNSAAHDYDIAVILVDTAFRIGSDGVNAVGLPSAGSTPTTGAIATVSGWGTLSSESSTRQSQLQAVDVPIVSTSSCRSSYGTSAITDRMLCAGFSSGGRDSCQGDSGGPLAIDNVLVGIVSWGGECALANYPGVYSHVGNLRNWIQTNTGI